MKNHVTISDIAKELGLSKSTVSRALSDSWEVSSETRERVQEAARNLNYQKNIEASNLVLHRSGTIGIIVPEFESGFFTGVILGAQQVCREKGYKFLITQSSESPAVEKENLELLMDNHVDGIMASVNRDGGNEKVFAEVLSTGIPMVFFNRYYPAVPCPRVVIDDYALAKNVTGILFDNGADNVIHMAGPREMAVSEERRRGWRSSLWEHGIMEEICIYAGATIDEGSAAMQKLLSTGADLPNALFAFNDNLAVGAMRAIRKAGLRIPEDMMIFGFSEGQFATFVEPNLSSVRQPTFEMGRRSASILLEMVHNHGKPKNSVIYLEASINLRESTIKL